MKALRSLFVDYTADSPLDLAELFGNTAPVRLEIGCGKGDFIKQLSERDGGYNYIAMEKIDDVIVAAAEKYAGFALAREARAKRRLGKSPTAKPSPWVRRGIYPQSFAGT